MIKNVDAIHELSILEVISDFVELKKQGANYIGCCPFHNEKTPSFHVSPSKNIYKCFGCGEGGNSAVTFLMEKEGYSYPEALEYVARKHNMAVEYQQGQQDEFRQQLKVDNERRKELHSILKQITAAYLKQTTKEHFKLLGRAYQEATLQQFHICYAPKENWILKAKQWPEEALRELQLIKFPDQGKPYDTFRNRILFPIFNNRGDIVGFGGRKPTSDTNKKNPKYINSSESLAFDKSRELYGLFQAKKAIREADEVILVEGYTDVLSLYDHGISNVVASCGTALTIEQAKLIKRYTSNVLILRDGDPAGRKAAIRDTELLIKQGLNPKVCILPEEEDPDSFIREHKKSGFEFYLEDKAEDGMIWRIMLEWDENNTIQKEKAFHTAGDLLSYIDSSTLKESYVRELCKKSRMGAVKSILKEVISEYEKKRLKKSDSHLNQEQQTDVINYGLYEDGQRYFVSSNAQNIGYQISNFTINPIMLVIGANESQRIVEIKNEYGKQVMLNLPSNSFTSMHEFKRETERMGNYLFTGKMEHFDKVKAKVYKHTEDCYPIRVMGTHREGFYTWGNGLSFENKFYPVNEFGVVEFNKTKYFLPAFSKLQDMIKSDEMEEEFEFEKKFKFNTMHNCISLEEWSDRMVQVHQGNGMMAVAYACSSLFRDIVFRKFSFFPHLNMFGPSGSGKTFICRSIMALFGQSNKQDPFNLSSGTPVAFKRRLAQVSNGIIWFDEYSNNIHVSRVEALKGAYDGAGHEKGVATQDNRTKTTKVKSALLISGQQQPTQDIALFKRVISLNFKTGKNSLDRQIKAKELKDIEETGQLTQITQFLLQFRTIIDEKFSTELERLRVAFNKQLDKDGHFVEDRIIQNHLIPLAIFNLLRQEIPFGFSITDFTAFVYQNIVEQSEAIFNEDELSIFWRIVEYLHEKRMLIHKQDIIIEEKKSEKFKNELDKKKKGDSLLKNFEQPKTLLYMRFAKIHPEYQDRHQKQRNKPGLDLQALQYYLKSSPAYLGQKKAKKFDGKAYACYVFDLAELPVELPLTVGASELPDL